MPPLCTLDQFLENNGGLGDLQHETWSVALAWFSFSMSTAGVDVPPDVQKVVDDAMREMREEMRDKGGDPNNMTSRIIQIGASPESLMGVIGELYDDVWELAKEHGPHSPEWRASIQELVMCECSICKLKVQSVMTLLLMGVPNLFLSLVANGGVDTLWEIAKEQNDKKDQHGDIS